MTDLSSRLQADDGLRSDSRASTRSSRGLESDDITGGVGQPTRICGCWPQSLRGLRLHDQRAGEEAAATPEGEQATRLHGARILLTEDNEINQQIAIELLEGAGATVKVANNGREAVEILSNGPQPPLFDLVLMDLQLPEMDGYQATAKLRSDARFATLPIIAMTAHATMEERQRCLAAGMNDHVSKPIDPGNLFEAVGRFCTASPARQSSTSPSEPMRRVEPMRTSACSATFTPARTPPCSRRIHHCSAMGSSACGCP